MKLSQRLLIRNENLLFCYKIFFKENERQNEPSFPQRIPLYRIDQGLAFSDDWETSELANTIVLTMIGDL